MQAGHGRGLRLDTSDLIYRDDVDEFRTAALVAATNGWWAGRLGPDDVVTAVGAGRTISCPDPLPLLAGLAKLREAGAKAMLLALPRPGDPGEFVAAPETLAGAIHAGAAAITVGATSLALVPDESGWTVAPAQGATLTDTALARRDLLAALVTASGEITAMDLGRNTPAMGARVDRELAGALSFIGLLDSRAADLALRAARVLVILDLARCTVGAALTASELRTQGRILGANGELETAARSALAAAVNDAARDLVARP